MHPQFLSFLRCPQSGQPLSLEITKHYPNGMVESGALIAPSGLRYPIVRGIPRFVEEEHYASSFGYEWNKWPRVQFETENVGRPMAGHTTRMWESITEQRGDLHGQTIVEFGCGPGRFLDVVRRKGAKAIGIDLSQAVEAARRNFIDDPDVLIVQGDLCHPPFGEAVADGGYSIGVLHHTPTPERGLQALTATVKRGGWISCCVYTKGSFYDFPSVMRFRKLHNSLKRIFGHRPALAYSYLSAYVLSPLMGWGGRIRGLGRLFGYLEYNWVVILNLPDARWRLLDIFDAITPSIATAHTGDEVTRWFDNARCKNLRATDWSATSIVCVKE